MLTRLIVFILLLATSGLANAEPRSGSQLMLHSLLTDSSPSFVLMGAKAVTRNPATDQYTLDIVAELLNERTKAHVGTGIDLDTTAWLMKALGASKNSRYRAVIDAAIATYSHEKITTFGSLSLAQLTIPSEAQYSTATISLDGLREALQAERTALTSSTGSFSGIKPGDTLDSVISNMGYPDQLLETVESKGWGHVKLRVRSLQLQYYGLGLVDIDNHFAAGSGWSVSAVWADVPNKAVPYSGANTGDAALIMTTEPMVLRKLAKRLVSSGVTEAELLDRVAERIQLSMHSEDEFEVDALAYLCRLLGESSNKAYVPALTEVANRAHEYDLKQYAKAALKKLEAG